MPLSTRQNSAAGEFLGKDFDFWTLASITAEADIGAAAVLNRVVEVIAINGQPVLLGAVTGTTTKTMKFAIEHSGSWTAVTLKQALIDHGNYSGVNFANVTVTLATGL